MFVLSCLIFVYLYFLLARPATTNFNLLVEDEDDYQVLDPVTAAKIKYDLIPNCLLLQ